MWCPLHRYVQKEDLADEKCPKCSALGQVAIECEIDKISRVMDTMNQQGYTLLQPCDGTKAVLVFKKYSFSYLCPICGLQSCLAAHTKHEIETSRSGLLARNLVE